MKVLYVDTTYECDVEAEVYFKDVKDLILNASPDCDRSGGILDTMQDYVDGGDGPNLTVKDHIDDIVRLVNKNINKAEYPNHKGYYSWEATYGICLDAIDEIRGKEPFDMSGFEDDELDIVEDYLSNK